jgi:hypothetical protein
VLAGFVLWMVKLSEVVPLNGMLPAPNALPMVGGRIRVTARLAVAGAPAPP